MDTITHTIEGDVMPDSHECVSRLPIRNQFDAGYVLTAEQMGQVRGVLDVLLIINGARSTPDNYIADRVRELHRMLCDVEIEIIRRESST